MSRLMHRTCDTTLAARESELRESTTRADRLEEALDTEIARGKRQLDLLVRAGDDVLDSRINAQIERKAASARESALLEEIDSLHARITDLEEDTSREAVLETRRRRAAETALEPAWHGPDRDSAGNRAQVAQALLALPLAAFDVALAYQLDGDDVWYWTIDGRAVDTDHWDYRRMDQEQVLIGRYGFTPQELAQIRRDAETAHRQMQDLTSEEF